MPPEPGSGSAAHSASPSMDGADPSAAVGLGGLGAMHASASEDELAAAAAAAGGMDYRLSWVCDQALTHLNVEQAAFDAFWHHTDARGVAVNAAAVVHFLDAASMGSTLLMYTTLDDLSRNVQRIHLSTSTLSDQIGRFRTIYILKNQNGPIKKPKDEDEVSGVHECGQKTEGVGVGGN